MYLDLERPSDQRRLSFWIMETTKLSAKGQVAHGWTPGVEFVVESTPAGVLLRPKAGKRAGRIAALAGILKRTGRRTVSPEAMDEAIASEVRARRARGRY